MTTIDEYPALVRTRGGRMAHLATCRYGKTGQPWLWAELKGWGRIQRDTNLLGVGFCIHCHPLSTRPYDDLD